jgi:hypothetical protein
MDSFLHTGDGDMEFGSFSTDRKIIMQVIEFPSNCVLNLVRLPKIQTDEFLSDGTINPQCCIGSTRLDRSSCLCNDVDRSHNEIANTTRPGG